MIGHIGLVGDGGSQQPPRRAPGQAAAPLPASRLAPVRIPDAAQRYVRPPPAGQQGHLQGDAAVERPMQLEEHGQR